MKTPSGISIGPNNWIKFFFEFNDYDFYSRLSHESISILDLSRVISDYYESDDYVMYTDMVICEYSKKLIVEESEIRENMIAAAEDGRLYCLYKQKGKYCFFMKRDNSTFKEFDYNILEFLEKFKIPMVKITSEKQLEKLVGNLDPYLNY